MKVAIIGAGASGLACAVEIAEKAKVNKLPVEIVLIEAKDKIGKKLLATGNGRCNMMNRNEGDYYFCTGDFSDFALKYFDVKSNLDFFASLGLYTRNDEEGRVYPLSNQASGVLDALRFACEGFGVKVLTEMPISSVDVADGKFYLNGKIKADVVVLACGGKALVKNFNGYELLKRLGHKITDVKPSLTKLEVADKRVVKQLKGVKQKGVFTLTENGKPVATEKGELLFTDYGLSGIAVMQLSAFYVRCSGRLCINADFVSELSYTELFGAVSDYAKGNYALKNENLLTGFVPKRLGEIIIKKEGLDLSAPAAELKENDIKGLVSSLKKFTFEISGARGFDDAQVTAGGADTALFNNKTMESKKIRNLYCIGELLDVDGLCGGYNLQWAWSSGRLCAESIINRLMSRKG